MTMTNVAVTLLIFFFATVREAASFAPSQTGNTRRTHLYGTIRFVGNASARLNTPPIFNDGDDDKSLSKFLASSASDPVLLGSKKGSKGAISQCERIIDSGGEESAGELWECKQASIGWFGLTLVPIFVNRIEKNPSESNVVISILDARTEITSGSRLGNTLASAMKRSKFEGRNAITWKSQNGSDNNGSESYSLAGDLKLSLTINLPPFLPLPPGFNRIGSKIVESTCRERLKQNLNDISNAYLVWATTPE